LFCHIDCRFLVALAYFAFHLVPRLRLHSAGRESRGAIAASSKHSDYLCDQRPLAWSRLELHHLGIDSRGIQLHWPQTPDFRARRRLMAHPIRSARLGHAVEHDLYVSRRMYWLGVLSSLVG